MTRYAAAFCLAACGPARAVSGEDAADVAAPGTDASVDGDVTAETVGKVDTSALCNLNCDDFNPCTDDVCYTAIGCTHVPHAGGCDDGNPCTLGDSCSGDACTGQPLNCDDGVPCSQDACVLPGVCTHTSC